MSWPLDIGDKIFYGQLGFVHHGAPGTLAGPVIAFSGARDSLGGHIGGGSGT
jgi:hypothetical protein